MQGFNLVIYEGEQSDAKLHLNIFVKYCYTRVMMVEEKPCHNLDVFHHRLELDILFSLKHFGIPQCLECCFDHADLKNNSYRKKFIYLNIMLLEGFFWLSSQQSSYKLFSNSFYSQFFQLPFTIN